MELVTKISKEHPLFEAAAEIRKRVFVDEQGFVDEFDDIDEKAYHAVAFDNEKAVACGRLYGINGIYNIGRIAVIPEYRGKGIGLLIMRRIENFARGINAEELVLSAQVQAKEFYTKLGFSEEGDVYYDEYCPHICMRKKIKSAEE